MNTVKKITKGQQITLDFLKARADALFEEYHGTQSLTLPLGSFALGQLSGRYAEAVASLKAFRETLK